MAVRKKLSTASLTSSCRNISCQEVTNDCVEKESKARWLGSIHEVPAYQRREYILGYYRLEMPCLRHFWRLHNEFGNMWSHALAALLMLVRWWLLMLLRFWFWWSQEVAPATLARQLYATGVVAFFLASLVTFGTSVMYHWRHCGKESEVRCWLCLDISSCALLLLVGFAAGVPMGFHCFPALQKGYMLQAATVCLAALGALATEGSRGQRSSYTLILGGVSALWPVLHWLAISRAGREVAGAWLLLVIFSGVAAAVFYCKNIPERFAPGRFDLFCSSHQLWHVFIYCAVAGYAEALVLVFRLTALPAFCD